MADLATLMTQRARLQEIRAKGVESYSIAGRSMSYRSDEELAAAIADLDRQIAAASNRQVRRIVVGTTKGF
jgi:hypothetical protein